MADATNQPTLDDVKAEIVDKHGLDPEIQNDLVENLAKERLDIISNSQKELSKAIDKKAEYRQQLIDKGLIDAKTFKPIDKKKPDGKTTDKLDYGQLAYLEAKGISDNEDIEFVMSMIKKTGDELKDVVNDDYVKNKLKTMSDARKADKAIPRDGKRTSKQVSDSVEYWLAKGELPPADQPQLRRDVVNAKLKKASTGSKFTDQPVVS